MTLYSKQINSVKALNAEKRHLQIQLKELEDLSFKDLLNDGLTEINSFEKKGMIGFLKSIFKSRKKSLLDVLPFVLDLFLSNEEEHEKTKEQIPKEIWESYLKWQAIATLFSTIIRLFKKKKK